MNASSSQLQPALKLITILERNGVSTLLYGSLGVSVFLGGFKTFEDIDLLVEETWLNNKWPKLIEIMTKSGYELTDRHEHEFTDNTGHIVNFAGLDILLRDKIIDSYEEIVTFEIDDSKIKTLDPQSFIKAYKFSAKDGYRKEKRGKKDREVIDLLKAYVLRQNSLQ